MIVGFPGETEQEFEITRKFVEEVQHKIQELVQKSFYQKSFYQESFYQFNPSAEYHRISAMRVGTERDGFRFEYGETHEKNGT